MKRYKTIFSSFHAIYRLITSSGDLKNFLSGIVRIFNNAFKADKVIIVCKNVSSYAFMKICLQDKKQSVKKGGVSTLTRKERDILNRGKEIILNDRLFYPFNFFDILGAIYVRRRHAKEAFTELEKGWFLALCEEVSVGLKIFNLYREEKRMILNYVKSLTNFLDQNVPTSYLHSRSVLRLIRALGKEMKLSKVQINSLEYAALLHDTGKIQLPSKILKKQKPLTEKEFELIMKHPRKGAELIKDLDALKPVIPIIIHHHERFNGKGYPSKLIKGQIPVGSRILSVIDAFDAMYFGRPYKKRRKLKEIEKEFKKQMGKQFDPKVVSVFLKILKRKSIRKYLRRLS